jgi:aminomethyltransferase
MTRHGEIAAAEAPAATPRGLRPSPLDARLVALNVARGWMNWAGCAAPTRLDSVEGEYFAIRNQASLFDVSPMRKYRVTGPDALAVMNRLVTRDLATLKPGRVAYAAWVDEDGFVIDDGTVFRFGARDFRLCCQERMFSWLHEIAWGFDAAIEDESEAVAGLAVQGPTAFSVLRAAGIEVGGLTPFGLAEPEPGLTVSRTGFTGDLGYELWVDADRALALWDRLTEAGAGWGLRPIGWEALDVARLEAGFLVAGVDYQPIHRALRPSRGRTPFELGLGWLVDLGKPHFNGRRALLAHAARGPRFALAAIDVTGSKPARDALVYARGREAGHVTSAVWSPTAKRNIGYAELRAPAALSPRDRLDVEIYLDKEGKWARIMAPLTRVERPFLRLPRARATPPAPF